MLESLDLAILIAGSLLCAGMLLFMLRSEPLLAQADDRGLHVGARVVPWSAVQRLQYAHGGAGSWLRVTTPDGLVELRDIDLAQPPDSLRRAIATRAGLGQRPLAPPPSGVRLQPGDVYEEWVPAQQAAAERAEVAQETSAARGVKVEEERSAFAKLAAAAIAVLAIVGKFGKVALLGGAKALKVSSLLPTLLSMLVTVWAYAFAWGWWFAAGFVALILLHELGHAVVMRAKGLRTSPIVFIPFLGAFIAIKDQFRDARTEAEVGFGGPAAGALAASACFGTWMVTGDGIWLGLGYVGFLLNLFNLLPVSPLDGGRVVTAVSTWLWAAGLLGALGLVVVTGSPILVIIVALGLLRAIREWRRRRSGEATDYYQLTPGYRSLMAGAYFGLCGYLGWMLWRVHELSEPVV